MNRVCITQLGHSDQHIVVLQECSFLCPDPPQQTESIFIPNINSLKIKPSVWWGMGVDWITGDLALLPSPLWISAGHIGCEHPRPLVGVLGTHPPYASSAVQTGGHVCRVFSLPGPTSFPPVAEGRSPRWQWPCGAPDLHTGRKFLGGVSVLSPAWWIALLLFLKAGMHAGNTCLTEIYSCSPSCLCRLQNWVMLFARPIP